MRSPDDVEEAQLREVQEEAGRLVAEVVREIEAQGPLRRGEQYLVKVAGSWSQDALTLAEDQLGHAGWRAVRLLGRTDNTGAACLLTCPEDP